MQACLLCTLACDAGKWTATIMLAGVAAKVLAGGEESEAA